jgi:hypothetical protein
MQVSAKLRACGGGSGDLAHWCPGCEEMHVLPWKRGGWTFSGDLAAPTFAPSFKHSWRGMSADGITPVDKTCHYVLAAGVMHFCGDCTHALVNQSVPLPDLPTELLDP